MKNYALDNKLENLIPVVNPRLKGQKGIDAALLYRILPCKEIDSSQLVKEAYEECYCDGYPDSSDTIFNAIIPLKDFCVNRLQNLSTKDKCYTPFSKGKLRKDLDELIYLYLDDIFCGYDELRSLFDEYCDLMYSFSNFMPAPKYFNGSPGKDGKGTWHLNKDYPYLYWQNLKRNEDSIYNCKDNREWLESNMKKYNIEAMYNLKPPYDVMKEYYSDDKLSALENFIKEAINLIKNRFC